MLEVMQNVRSKMVVVALVIIPGILDIQPKVVIGIAVGSALAYVGYKQISKLISNRQPQRWREVGTISDLWIFPIKSCGPVNVNELNCAVIGPAVDHLRDRVFCVCRSSGDFLTARTYPKMVLISPKFNDHIMTLSAPDMENIEVDILKLHALTNFVNIKIWSDNANVIDCGDEIGAWLSRFILGEPSGLRLVFYPSSDPKPVVNPRINRTAERVDTGTLHDETSFMLMNESSFVELNGKLEKPVAPLQFRPNFVVNGPNAFDEDKWDWVRIGDNVIFRNVQPCLRCVLTTIDPETGEKDKKQEPLKTLKSFRTFEKYGSSPWFGIHLGIRKLGIVKKGDVVYVGEK